MKFAVGHQAWSAARTEHPVMTSKYLLIVQLNFLPGQITEVWAFQRPPSSLPRKPRTVTNSPGLPSVTCWQWRKRPPRSCCHSRVRCGAGRRAMRSCSGPVTAAASVNCGTIAVTVRDCDIQTGISLLPLQCAGPFHTKAPSQKSRTLKGMAPNATT